MLMKLEAYCRLWVTSYVTLLPAKTRRMGFARAAANRVIFIDEGQIVEESTPEDMFASSTNKRTKLFLSKVLQI